MLNILRSLRSKYFYRKVPDVRTLLLSRYAEIHPSAIDRNIRIRLDNPIDRKYLFIGEKSIVNGNFIFESQRGEVRIGKSCFIGGSTFISHSSIHIGNHVTIAWGGAYMTMILILSILWIDEKTLKMNIRI